MAFEAMRALARNTTLLTHVQVAVKCSLLTPTHNDLTSHVLFVGCRWVLLWTSGRSIRPRSLQLSPSRGEEEEEGGRDNGRGRDRGGERRRKGAVGEKAGREMVCHFRQQVKYAIQHTQLRSINTDRQLSISGFYSSFYAGTFLLVCGDKN